MVQYLIDSDVLISAKNLHYGFDFCPGYWDWLVLKNKDGIVASIEKVGDEIHCRDDKLTNWADQQGESFFLKPTRYVVEATKQISTWLQKSKYEPSAIATFSKKADLWLVGHALASGCTVVTQEVPADSVQQVKIPDVCSEFKLKCINTFEMLRKEQARFILKK